MLSQAIEHRARDVARAAGAAKVAWQHGVLGKGALQGAFDGTGTVGQGRIGVTVGQPVEHHGHRQQHRAGVGQALAGDVGRGAVGRLEQAVVLADVLVAGIIGGPAVAGVVRIARQIGSAMGQLSDPLMQAIYPEMSSAAAAHRTAEVRALVVRAGLWGASAGAAIVVTLWFAASTVLTLAAGAEYVVGAPALMAYAIAQALSLATLAVSPALLSLGRARESFIALCVATGVYVLALFPAIRAMGSSGAGWALVLFQLCWGLMATRPLLRATLPKADTGIDDDVHPPQSTSSQLETRAA